MEKEEKRIKELFKEKKNHILTFEDVDYKEVGENDFIIKIDKKFLFSLLIKIIFSFSYIFPKISIIVKGKENNMVEISNYQTFKD